MTEFLDVLEGELRTAAGAHWSRRRAPRRHARALVVAATLVAAIAIGAVVLLTGPGERRDSVPAGGAPTTYVSAARDFTVRYPAGWTRATRRLTPALSDPREILAVGSGSLPAQQVATDCAQLPTRALLALRSGEALVTIQERSRPGRGYRQRPARWDWGRTGHARIECLPDRVDARWLSFRDAGRGFHALVAVGFGSSEAVGRRAMAVLNSFRPQPR